MLKKKMTNSQNWINQKQDTTSSSCTQSGTYTLLGESCMQRLRGLYMLLMCSFMVTMGVCSNLVAYAVLKPEYSYDMGVLGIWVPWRSYAIIIAVPLGLGAGLLWFFNESPKFLLNMGRERESLKALKDIWTRNGGDPDKYPVKKLTLDEDQTSIRRNIPFVQTLLQQVVPLFRPPLLYRTLQLYYLNSVIYSTLSGFFMWYPFIVNAFLLTAKDQASGNHGICDMLALATGEVSSNKTATMPYQSCNNKMEFNTALAATMEAFTYILLTLCVYKFAAWRRRMLIAFMLMASLAGFGVTSTPEPVSGLIFYLIFSLHGLCLGILSSYFVDLFPTSYRGMAACLSVIVARLSMMTASGVIGMHITTHCTVTFLVSSLYLLSGVAVAWFLPLDNIQN